MGITCGTNASGYAKNAQCNSKSVMAKKPVSFGTTKKVVEHFYRASQASNVDNDMEALVDRVKNIVGNYLGIIRRVVA